MKKPILSINARAALKDLIWADFKLYDHFKRRLQRQKQDFGLGIFSLILYARFIKQKIPYRAKRVEATKCLIKDASRQVEESCSIEQKASDWNPKAARPAKVCVLATDWRSTESLVQYEQL